MGPVRPPAASLRVRRPALTSRAGLDRVEVDDGATTVHVDAGAAGPEKDQHMRMSIKPASSPQTIVPAEYLPLHKYLENRFADTVVLTIGQIEDLLGFALPSLAHFQREWWTTAEEDHNSSPQSRSWTEASRTATVNMSAQIVVFERTSA
jgi:hypothetical protein